MLGDYVEGIANADPVNAVAIVKSAGMDVKAESIRTAHEFNAKSTGVGEVKLATRSENRATFIWQMSTDASVETNWQTIGMGTQAKFVKTGLMSGTRYYFRVSVVDKNGQGPWSNVINLIAQ